MKDEWLVPKWKVKLIFRGAWNSLMAWPDWPDHPWFTTDLRHWPSDSHDMTSTVHTNRHTTAATVRKLNKQYIGRRPPRYASVPLLPLWVPKRLAPPSRPQRSSSFPRPIRSHFQRYSCLRVNTAVSKATWWPWRLTFDLESGVRVTCDVGLPLCQF